MFKNRGALRQELHTGTSCIKLHKTVSVLWNCDIYADSPGFVTIERFALNIIAIEILRSLFGGRAVVTLQIVVVKCH